MPESENKARGGGWNKKTAAEHLRDGTYRSDRHGPLPAAKVGPSKKPAGKVTASARSQSRWIRSAADEHAVRNGSRYNERLAEYVCEFFAKNLCHTKGQWRGDPFELTTGQREAIISPLFGWVREDGTRRFRRSYIEIPKKNYKSTLASGIGLYMLTGDEEPGAEIWSLGGDKSQARVVHDEAVAMAEGSPALAAILKIHHSTFNITYPATNSYYRAVSASPRGKHGPSLHCAIADELHEWYGDELWKSIRYAFRARRQPLLLVITNAGNNLQSLCYRQREKAKAVLDGSAVDDDFFAMILSASREEAEAEIQAVKEGATELPVAAQCNPGLGHVIQVRDLVQDIRDAILTPSELGNLLRLTYGVWDTAVSPWLQTSDWEACEADFTADDLVGCECHEALDLSLTGDMSAVANMFACEGEDGQARYRLVVHFWIPEKTVEDRKHLIDYRAWEQAGCLTIVPGAVIEYGMIREALAEIHSRYDVRSFSYDPMYATDTAQWVEENYPQIECVKFAQNIMTFAGPTAEMERLVRGRKIEHNKNPLLTWQAGHCKVWTDSNRNKRPTKPKANDIRSIDGLVASVMALSRAWQPPETPSAYEDDETQFNSVEDIMSDEFQEDEVETAGPGDTAGNADEDPVEVPIAAAKPKAKSAKRKPRAEPTPALRTEQQEHEAAAIAAVDAGEDVECLMHHYRRGVRQALQAHAIRLNDQGQTERCRAVLDEIRRLDEDFGEQ